MSGPWAPDPPPPRHEVTIVDFDVPMMSLVRFMLKWFFATIIAAIIPVSIWYLLVAVTALIFGR